MFCLFAAGPISAQTPAPDFGFASLPSFAWPRFGPDGAQPVEHGYARISTGFEVRSSKRFGGYAGPTVGFEGGKLWRDGDVVYGVVGGFDYLGILGGPPTPRFGGLAYSRDFAGALHVKAGAFLTEDVLVYTKVGGRLVNETWRFGPTANSLPFSRDDIALRPDARVGVEWAVTDRLTIGIEAGVAGRGLR